MSLNVTVSPLIPFLALLLPPSLHLILLFPPFSLPSSFLNCLLYFHFLGRLSGIIKSMIDLIMWYLDLFFFACAYVCVCGFLSLCVYMCVCVYVHFRVYVCVCVYCVMFLYRYICIFICVYVYVSVYTPMLVEDQRTTYVNSSLPSTMRPSSMTQILML